MIFRYVSRLIILLVIVSSSNHRITQAYDAQEIGLLINTDTSHIALLMTVDGRIVPKMASWYLLGEQYRDISWSVQQKTLVSSDGRHISMRNSTTNQIVFTAASNETIAYASLSPDGKLILFTNTQLVFEKANQKTALPIVDFSIRAVSLDQNIKTVVSPKHDDMGNNDFFLSKARWSPDGIYIAFEGHEDNELNEGNIYLSETQCLEHDKAQCSYNELKIVDGSGARLIEEDTNPENWLSPTWSPDSKRLGFICGRQICTLGRNGTKFQRFTISASDSELVPIDIEWSPEGQYIAYNFNNDIYLLNLEDRTTTNLTNTPSVDEYEFTWLTWPDAEFLLK
jgi:Tol biopolymer transport system component